MAGPGNGNPLERYDLDRSDSYLAGRRNLEEKYPRLRQLQVFDLIEVQVRCFPPDEHAALIGEQTWSYATQEGAGIPELDIYFTFEAETITMQEVFASV